MYTLGDFVKLSGKRKCPLSDRRKFIFLLELSACFATFLPNPPKTYNLELSYPGPVCSQCYFYRY